MKKIFCDFCNHELSYSEEADFSELVEFDICKECSEEMPISISYA